MLQPTLGGRVAKVVEGELKILEHVCAISFQSNVKSKKKRKKERKEDG